MKYPNWKIPSAAPEVPEALRQAGYPPLLAALLARRGLTCPEEAERFLYCGLQSLQDPRVLPDMTLAVTRLEAAIAAGERTAVFGDYDVDGITAGCLLTDYLRSRGLPCELYIPDRLEEGYGLNCAAISALHARGVRLLVTVDCGVTAVEEVLYAKSLGMDVIITDHHECQGQLPQAVAVVDPKRPDAGPAGEYLAGVGVAFKLACALEGNSRRCLRRYADLVAVGTVADMMPLVGENRYIIRVGLDKLREQPRPGLWSLIEEAGAAEKPLNAATIGFTMAPRINAAGRLGRCGAAVELLLETDAGRCRRLAADLCEMNRDRQSIESDIWNEANRLLLQSPPTGPIVLAADGWHQGVIGIAAARLAEAYQLPAIIICLDGEWGKGSCRSYSDFPLYDALKACSAHLEGFGGHAMAAGLTIRREALEDFRAAMAAYYQEHPPQAVPALEAEIRVEEPGFLEMESVQALDLLEPCGNGNPRPLLCMTDVLVTTISPIGGGKHLRLTAEKFGRSYEAVFFSQTVEALGLRAGQRADIMFFPQINSFRGRQSVQLLLTDLRPAVSCIAREEVPHAGNQPSRP